MDQPPFMMAWTNPLYYDDMDQATFDGMDYNPIYYDMDQPPFMMTWTCPLL